MNYYEFKREIQTCEHCHWQGPGRDAPILESFADLAEYACPRCGEKIAVVAYPTIAESRENWNKLDPTEQRYIEAIEATQQKFVDRSLKTPDQLPDIDLPAFVLIWDDDGSDGPGGDTVIRLGDRVIWREPSV